MFPATQQRMTKRDLVHRFIEITGKAFLTPKESANVIGIGRERMTDILEGVDFIWSGNTKRYFVDNIAGRLIEVKDS